MPITVHTISGAPRAWRVLMGLTFKGLEWDTALLQASTRDHKAPTFLELNPRGTVPVLEADGLVLRDSIGILAWLDRRYPDRPLFGETAEEAGTIWQITLECCDYLRDAGNRLLFPVLVLGKPLPEPGSEERVALEASADAMHAECRFLEDLLEHRLFLAGDRPTAADAVAFPEIRLVQRAVETKPEVMSVLGFADPPAIYPKIAAWKSRIAALPGVDKTLPPHWHA